MFKYYTSGQYRNVYCKLEDIQLLSANHNNIKYNKICQYFLLKDKDQSFLTTELQIMKRQKITAEKCVKFLAFIHTAVQNSEKQDLSEALNPFLAHLLKISEEIIKKQSKKSYPLTTDNMLTSKKSPVCASQTIRATNRNSTDKLSKQLYLNFNVIKPYITYLFKLLTIQDFYKDCKASKFYVDFNQAWVIINILKLIQAVTKSFQHVGRYYYKEYQGVIVMLTQCFSRDIDRFYPKVKAILSQSVKQIQLRYSKICLQFGKLQAYQNLDDQGIDQTVKMLQQIQGINETLYQMYMNKYFITKIQHVLPPNWIETTDRQYDFVFHLWKIKNKVDFERARRGLKKTQSLFAKIKGDGSKLDFSKADFSVSFIKKTQPAQISFKNMGQDALKPFTAS